MTDLLAIVANAIDRKAAAEGKVNRIALRLSGDFPFVPPVGFDRGAQGPPLCLLVPVPVLEPAHWATLSGLAEHLGADEFRIVCRPGAQHRIPGEIARQFSVIGLVSGRTPPDTQSLETMADGGFKGVMVADPDHDSARLLDAMSVPDIEDLVTRCHAHGLRIGVSGALELPDIPRLLALDVDELGFDLALRNGAHGAVDPDRVAMIRDLILTRARAPKLSEAGMVEDEADRIFVHDWILPVDIGSYAHEFGARQRVRFSVDASLKRREAAVKDIRDVVSYDLITDAIRRLIVDHVDWVETLAERIAAVVLSHPRITHVVVTVEKLDLGPGSLGCRIARRRGPA